LDSDILKFFGVMLAIAVAGSVGYTLVALGHTLAQRLGYRSREGGPPPEQLAEMQERLTELDEVRERLAEVEERLDFAERALVEQRARRAGEAPPGLLPPAGQREG
jgi:hypothetical protein